MEERATLKRYLVFLAGVFICAMGIALLSRSGLGTSPLSSVSFVLSLATGIGTLVSAVAVGQFVKLYSHKLGSFRAWVQN